MKRNYISINKYKIKHSFNLIRFWRKTILRKQFFQQDFDKISKIPGEFLFTFLFFTTKQILKTDAWQKWVKSIFTDTWTLLLSYHRIFCRTIYVWLFCPFLKSTVRRGIRTDGYWIHRVLCMYVCIVWGRKKFILLHSIGGSPSIRHS